MANPLNVLHDEFHAFYPRLYLVRLLTLPFPPYTAFRLRPWLLRLIGFSIGRDVAIFANPTIVGQGDIYSKLAIGDCSHIGVGVYFDLAGKITIHDHVAVGLHTLMITGTHSWDDPRERRGTLQARDIEVGSGAWIGARCTILPGVKIGNGAVIAAGAVVAKDIPANTMYGGVPAKLIRELSDQQPEYAAAVQP